MESVLRVDFRRHEHSGPLAAVAAEAADLEAAEPGSVDLEAVRAVPRPAPAEDHVDHVDRAEPGRQSAVAGLVVPAVPAVGAAAALVVQNYRGPAVPAV